MSFIMVDIEADGPIPCDYSMVAIGAIVVDQSLDKTFYGKLRPISEKYDEEALKVTGFSREETFDFNDPKAVMSDFREWIRRNNRGRVFFISDNSGFDWQFVNWYFHHFLHENPFGFSPTDLGSLYKGLVKNMFKNFKQLRKTKHTHNPVDDSRGNAEAFLYMKNEMGLIIHL